MQWVHTKQTKPSATQVRTPSVSLQTAPIAEKRGTGASDAIGTKLHHCSHLFWKLGFWRSSQLLAASTVASAGLMMAMRPKPNRPPGELHDPFQEFLGPRQQYDFTGINGGHSICVCLLVTGDGTCATQMNDLVTSTTITPATCA